MYKKLCPVYINICPRQGAGSLLHPSSTRTNYCFLSPGCVAWTFHNLLNVTPSFYNVYVIPNSNIRLCNLKTNANTKYSFRSLQPSPSRLVDGVLRGTVQCSVLGCSVDVLLCNRVQVEINNTLLSLD